jgi:transposase-like protein
MKFKNEYDHDCPTYVMHFFIKCPYCHSDYDLSKNEDYEVYNDENESEFECSNCKEYFLVTTLSVPSFSTYKKLGEINK